ncbi:hypothetical protein J3B02_001297 [Coemansia erecta]|nr:hypothetical protein J3B02_001297 [Coemansia erecta]
MTSGAQERAALETESTGSQRSSIDKGKEAGTVYESDSANINNYIASLHLERSNTKASAVGTIIRRKTLIKQANDPKTDQAALEQEIKHVERLASLLGRRQTRFKHKSGKVKVNHDLDETLDGFFDVYEDEKVEDILLNVGTRQLVDGKEDDSPVDPELKQQNIGAASTALIVSHQESQLDFNEDPFDKIEAMNLKKSPSGSAEYLPIDDYVTGSNDSEEAKAAVAATASNASTSATSATSNIWGAASVSCIGSSKVTSNVDANLTADTLDLDSDELEASINRSNTWKRQSVILIQERQKYGPALPRIADVGDDKDSESETESELSISEMSDSTSESSESDVDDNNKGQQAAGTVPLVQRTIPKEPIAAAFFSQKTPTSAGISNREVISDYLDILDFIDSNDSPASKITQLPVADSSGGSGAIKSNVRDEKKGKKGDTSGGAFVVVDDDDGHVSSDPSRNSDSSEIELSENNDSDSDSHYLSRLGTQQTFKIANVLSSEESCNVDGNGNGKQQLAATGQGMLYESVSAGGNTGLKQVDEIKGTADNADASQASSLLASRSTLRRNRRVLSKGRSLRYGTSLSKPGTATHPGSSRSANASVRTSIASDAGIDTGVISACSQVLKQGPVQRLGTKTKMTAASIASAATTASSKSGLTAVANYTNPAAFSVAVEPEGKQQVSSSDGLARLASEAVAAASRLSTARGTRAQAVQPSNAWSSKPLPVAPDRVVRTMEVAHAAALSRPETAQGLQSSSAAAARGRLHGPLPPLPQKERPRIPKDLAESGLETRAEASAALELPSSRTLFEASGKPSSLSQNRRMSVQHLHMHGVASAHQLLSALPLYQHQKPDSKPESAGMSLEEWLRRTDMLLPSNNHVEKPPPFPPGSEGKQTFNTYYYVPADKLSAGSASPSALSQSNSEIGSLSSKTRNSGRPATANSGMRAKGRVVRTVTLVPPSIPTASARRSFSSASSIHSSASHQPFSISNSPLHSRANSPFGSHRVSITSTVSIPTSTHSAANLHLEHDLEPTSTTAYVQASTASTSSPRKFFSDPPSMSNQPHTQAHAHAYVASTGSPYGSYAPTPASASAAPGFLQPNVLSAPPGDDEPAEIADAPAAEGFAEPSAPMLLEPTAPELPGQWSAAAPYAGTYAFPMPMPGYYDPAAYGYSSPGVAAGFSPQASMGFAVPVSLSMVAQQQVYQHQIPEQLYMQLQQQQVVNVPGTQSPTIVLVPERPLPQTPPTQIRPKPLGIQRPRPQSVPGEQQLHQQQEQIPPPVPPKSLPVVPKRQSKADQPAAISPPPTYEYSQNATGKRHSSTSANTAPNALASVISPCPSDFIIVSI